MRIQKWIQYGVVIGLLAVSCSQIPVQEMDENDIQFVTQDPVSTATPFQPGNPIDIGADETTSQVDATSLPTEFTEDMAMLSLGISPEVPKYIYQEISVGKNIEIVEDLTTADIVLKLDESCEDPSFAVLVLAAPFPTVIDGVALQQIEQAWAQPQAVFNDLPILMDQDTYHLLQTEWGKPSQDAVQIESATNLVTIAWDSGQFAILPFHLLTARWKVIQIDGMSSLDRETPNAKLPLSFGFCLSKVDTGDVIPIHSAETIQGLRSNRETELLTSVTMTGVTALVRAIADRMESNGILYPAEKIRNLLLSSDFTHISNEVAFDSNCPTPNPYQTDLRFCSSPKYIELLDYLDIDIIELTGNHIQDYGREPFVETLSLYETGGYSFFGAGRNLNDAKEPLLIEHNGNQIAFLGCNAVGPPGAWATDTLSGNVPCGDYSWIEQKTMDLTADGYLVIVTLQHNEFYGMMKTGPQIRDFNPLAQAGAVIVSGSQAHYPQPFGFEGDHFIHYGLGNLFFDQMDAYVAAGIQRQFVDTHYFYDGQYISTQIHTLYLENFSQPRIMTPEERHLFLEEAFKASGW